MNPSSTATLSKNTVLWMQDNYTLTTLPEDISPQIFGRLPVSSFFSLACTSKQAYCLVEPRLRCEAETRLGKFSPALLKESVQVLAPLLRTGFHHISEDAWRQLFEAAANKEIGGDLMEMLLFSFAADDEMLEKLPLFEKLSGYMRHHQKFIGRNAYKEWPKYIVDAEQFYFSISREEMIKAERLGCVLVGKRRQLSDRRGWKISTRIFSQFDVALQQKLLLQLKPADKNNVHINLAFEKLVVVHLASMKSFPPFIFWPNASRQGEIESYSDMLADVYSLTSPQTETSYLIALCKNGLYSLPANVSWRKLMHGPAKLLFRLLAYEIRNSQAPDPTGRVNNLQSRFVKSFITPAELDHFSREINACRGRGVALETAVDEWMNENHEPEKCVIS
jgi:hypothetical protein